MSKSFDFCIARASNPEVSTYSDRNWKDAIEIKSEEWFDHAINGMRKYKLSGKNEEGDEVSYNIELIFNPDSDFDFFTSKSVVCDGTLCFIEEAMAECADRVCKLGTVDKSKPLPESGDTMRYTIGNWIYLSEYGDFGTEEKPWLKARYTVLLPLKTEIIKGDKNETNNSN